MRWEKQEKAKKTFRESQNKYSRKNGNKGVSVSAENLRKVDGRKQEKEKKSDRREIGEKKTGSEEQKKLETTDTVIVDGKVNWAEGESISYVRSKDGNTSGY